MRLPLQRPPLGQMPAGFRWDRTRYPVPVVRAGGAWRSVRRPSDFIDPAISAAFYVDGAAGNNANAGTSASPVKSLWRAIQLGNAANVPFWVLARAGTYLRNDSWTNNNTVQIAQTVAFGVWGGGRVATGPFDDLAWPGSPDGTFGNTWSLNRGGVARVVDLLAQDAWGKYVELASVASATLANSTPGSWAQVGGQLYVRRHDGAPPTNANTRVYLTADSFVVGQAAGNIYLGPGFDLEGGTGGTVRISGTAANTTDRIFAAEGCTARYAGSASIVNSCWRVLDWKGLVFLADCVGAAAVSDGFNAHYDLADGGACHVLLDACRGHDNGRFSSQSDNGLTMHDTCSVIDISGSWRANRGATVRHIDVAHGWHLGASATDDLGDVALGGAIGPTNWRGDNSARLWLDDCLAEGADTAIAAYDSAQILLRRTRIRDGLLTKGASAAIAPY